MATTRARLLDLLHVAWHPHQKLWNWRLEAGLRRVGRRVGRPRLLVRPLVAADSALLTVRVLARRVRVVPLRHLFALVPPSGRRVLYVDCGVHKQGEQLRCTSQWFANRCRLQMLAFEASSAHARDAAQHLADLPHLDLRRVALVGPDNDAEEVKLYLGAGDGRADSVVAATGSEYELVPAARLSDVLRRDHASYLEDAALLVRMNIEGSEYDVVDDLVRNGLHERVDGWFGMWDDVGKRDPDKDRRFRHLLRANGITTTTFNDRDLTHPLRRFAIRLALDTAIRRAPTRPASASAAP
jgi:hypothetical protein